MKVWILYRSLLDLNTLEEETDWWIHKSEEGAKVGFESELEAYYERFGKYRAESYREYHLEEDQVLFEVDRHRFLLVYQEEPVFK